MNRIKGREWILAVLCVLLTAATVILTVQCVRAAKELREAMQVRDRLSASADTLRGELDTLNGELDRLESERARSEEDLTEKTAKIESLEELISGLNDERDSLNGENGELAAQLEEANRVADLLREDVEGLSRRIDAKREAASVLRERSRQLTEAVESLEGELSDANDALDDKQSELTDAKKKLMKTQSELKVAQSERNDAMSELEDAKDELDSTKSELKDTKEALDASEKARKSAEEKLVPAVTAKVAPVQTPQQSAELNDAEKTLLNTLANAPYRWDWTENKTKLVSVKPIIAYYTAAVDGSEELAYNADTVLYCASLIKAPYILSVLREIENFEKTAQRNADGKIVYRSWEKKYDLDEEWVYDPATMKTGGFGEIQNKAKGFRLTWRELFEYTLLYSDNIAFSQIYNRFGFTSFNSLVWQLGIEGQKSGFMYLTARDAGKFAMEIRRYFETATDYANWMKDLMIRSLYGEMIAVYYPAGTVAHKYGWDVNAFHDMAIVEAEKPYVLVIMTDYEDGGNAAFAFFGTVVEQTKAVYASK
ncbi:MAG: serine hydrolase [Clostridiales bacterium]|nr:serine hydrolase [Clostridiales bacterium]